MRKRPRLVWIFSSGRSGTTWLMKLLGESLDAPQWSEPRFGRMLEKFEQNEGWAKNSGHLLSEAHRPAFIAGVRGLVRGAAETRFPKDKVVVIKEPAGSEMAPYLGEATPDSMLIAVVRDLRDVVASSIDGKKAGNWQNRQGTRFTQYSPEEMTQRLTANSVRHMAGAVKAYDQHQGPRTLVRYEDLLSDTETEFARMLRDLGLKVKPEKIRRVVEANTFGNVSEEQRGEGKFFRRASPGSWTQDLDDEQRTVVEDAAAPIMDRFYPGWREEQG